MTPVRLEPAALRSQVKHSTTEPLHSHFCCDEVSREVYFVLIALSIAYFGVRIPLLYMRIGVSCMTHFCNKQLFMSVFTMLFL